MSTQVIEFNNVENVVFNGNEVGTLKLHNIVVWEMFKKLAQLADKTIESVSAEDLSGLTSIRQYAFYECLNLTSVVLPEGLTVLGTSAFSSCPLTEMTFPASLTNINQTCFQYCYNLSTIRFLSLTPPKLGATAFSWSSVTRCEVPVESLDKYKTSIPEFKNVMVGV
jgi:hypothetical protein